MPEDKPLSATDIRNRNTAEELARRYLVGTDYADALDAGLPFLPVTDPKGNVVGVHIGEMEVLQGRTPDDKPLIRHKDTKRRYKGSGRYGPPSYTKAEPVEEPAFPLTPRQSLELIKNKPDDFRETISYREAFEQLFPAGGDVAQRGSLAWFFDQAWSAAEGSPQLVECPHPEVHKDRSPRTGPLKHVVAFRKEANLIFKMIELAVGKAQQTVNVNVNEKKLVESLEHRVIDVHIQSIDARGVDSRIDMIKQFGYIEGSSEPVIEGKIVDTIAGANASEPVPEAVASSQ